MCQRAAVETTSRVLDHARKELRSKIVVRLEESAQGGAKIGSVNEFTGLV